MWGLSSIFHEFHHGVLLSYHPDDVTLAETAVGVDGGQVFLSFLHTDEHAVVFLSDAAVFQSAANEWTSLGEPYFLELHLAFLYVGVFRHDVGFGSLGKSLQLLVVANGLETVAGEDNGAASWDVDALVASQDTAYMDTVTSADA